MRGFSRGGHWQEAVFKNSREFALIEKKKIEFVFVNNLMVKVKTVDKLLY